MEKKQKVIKAYKGFNDKLQCRGFQYEIGKEYKTNGKISCCENGFHACQSPLEVLDYYFLLDNAKIARFCEVEQAGTIDGIKGNCTKTASSKIRINRELTFSELIKLGIEWLKENTKTDEIESSDLFNSVKEPKKIGSSGDDAQIASSGDDAKIASSGYGSKIASSGNHAQIGSGGNYAQIGTGGEYAKIGSSGDDVQIGSGGDCVKIGSSGSRAKIGCSGDYAKIGSSGNHAQIGSSGDHAQIGSGGDSAKISSSGYYAQIGCSGDYAQIGCSGNHAQIGSSGRSAQIGSSSLAAKIDSTGDNSIICCTGHNSIVKAKKGSWITLSEWVNDEDLLVPKCVKTEYVDGERIKENTWYKLVNGEFTEVEA